MERIDYWAIEMDRLKDKNTRLIILIIVLGLIIGSLINLIAFCTYDQTHSQSADLNHDGQVNMADFSIMMSQWTEEK